MARYLLFKFAYLPFRFTYLLFRFCLIWNTYYICLSAAHPLCTLSYSSRWLITISFSYERALFWNFPQTNQMTSKLPYIGRSIIYYTAPVASCIVLGRFDGFWFCQWRPYNKNWQGRQLFPTFATTHLAFCQVTRWPASTTWKPICVGTCTNMKAYTNCGLPVITQFPSIGKSWRKQISSSRSKSYKICTGSAKEITEQ